MVPMGYTAEKRIGFILCKSFARIAGRENGGFGGVYARAMKKK